MGHRVCAPLLLVGLLGVGPSTIANADEPPPTVASEKSLKALIHINFEGDPRQEGGLRNIEAILAEVGDDGCELLVVCHSGGIGLVVAGQSPFGARIEALQARGVRFVACRNTMRQKGIDPGQLLPAVGVVPSGAVEVIRKQQEGYSYFRP